MSKLIDANVILRYLLNDLPDQAAAAKVVIESGAHTIPEVIAEVVYVLRGVYKAERKEIRDAVASFLDEIETDCTNILLLALDIYAERNIDFVDSLLVSRSLVNGDSVFSFDKRMNKVLAEMSRE